MRLDIAETYAESEINHSVSSLEHGKAVANDPFSLVRHYNGKMLCLWTWLKFERHSKLVKKSPVAGKNRLTLFEAKKPRFEPGPLEQNGVALSLAPPPMPTVRS